MHMLVLYLTDINQKSFKLVKYLIKKEVNSVNIQFQRQCLQKRYVISHHFLIREIKLVHYDAVDMII